MMTSPRNQGIAISRVVWFGPLLLMWLATLGRGRFAWDSSFEYGYGWIVPVLAAMLIVERARTANLPIAPRSSGRWIAGLAAAMLAWCVARFLLEPFPFWTGALWLLFVAAVAVTLCVPGMIGGVRLATRFALPVAFVLTALPWPETIRQPIMRIATPLLANVAAFIANEFAGPAVRHGNAIEVGTGWLGVAEACTGLRSLESCLMVAVFAGEFFGLRRGRRVALVIAGFGFALGSNLLRTTVLACRAASAGIGEVASWHDPIGYAALLLTVLGILSLAWSWQEKPAIRSAGEFRAFPARPVSGWLVGALLVIVAGEIMPRLWFEPSASIPSGARIAVTLPAGLTGFRATAYADGAKAALGCDDMVGGTWTANGGQRAGYLLRWSHGHDAAFRIALHNPRICLPLTGARLVGDLPPVAISVGAEHLPVSGVAFRDEQGDMSVYFLGLDLESGSPLRTAPRSWAEWLKWRWNVIASGQRDQHAAVCAIGFRNSVGQSPAAEIVRAEFAPWLQRIEAGRVATTRIR